MRFRFVYLARAASVLLLALALLCEATLRGEARIANLLAAPHPSLSSGAAAASSPTEGGRIAFASWGEIYLVNADGSGLTRLTYSEPGVYNFQPALSPDGLSVAFGSAGNDQTGIKIIGVDGSGLRSVTANSTSFESEPAWSPDGSKIAFVRGFDPTAEGVANHTTCGFEIYVVGVDNPHEVNLTQGRGGTDPSWSPSGERIAFASDRAGDFDIYSMTSEGGDVQQLTVGGGDEAEPAWSPDGKRIAYTGNLLGMQMYCGFAHTGLAPNPVVNGPDIFVMPSEGGEQTRLTSSENNIEPAWSPDGLSLAFIGWHDGLTQIYVQHSSEERAYSITSDASYKTSPSWAQLNIIR